MDSVVAATNFRKWDPTTAEFKRWYGFVTTIMVFVFLGSTSAFHMLNTDLLAQSRVGTEDEIDLWSFTDSIYYTVMTYSTIGLGDFAINENNMASQFFAAIFSAIFGVSLLASYLGQYGQWATVVAAGSPVDVSHGIAYGGDGPFVDEETKPTRRASLQKSLGNTLNYSQNESKTIAKRLSTDGESAGKTACGYFWRCACGAEPRVRRSAATVTAEEEAETERTSSTRNQRGRGGGIWQRRNRRSW